MFKDIAADSLTVFKVGAGDILDFGAQTLTLGNLNKLWKFCAQSIKLEDRPSAAGLVEEGLVFLEGKP